MDPSLVSLLAFELATRLAAIDRVLPTLAGLHGLRGALFEEDARVRAAAARRLGLLGDREAAPWLREALGRDPRPTVREAALVALARLGDREAIGLSDRSAREDPVWWVRRAALFTAATLAGKEAIPTLWAASEDPFWRVRHAGTQALIVLGDADPSGRDFLLSFEGCRGPWAEGVRGFLGARWGRVLAPLPAVASELPATSPLLDPDPAVTTARLLDASEVDPRVLLQLLADPHEPLRRLATRRLIRTASPEILHEALRWLDGRQPPHAADAARLLLGRADEALVAPLVQRVLRETSSPGVYRWAASWAALHRRDECREALAARLHDAAAQVRAASLRALAALDPRADDLLATALGDPDEEVQAAVAAGLHEGRGLSPATIHQAYLSTFVDELNTKGQSLALRRALIEQAARHSEATTLRRGLRDPDGAIRARSTAALASGDLLTPEERAEARRDADPWVRAAALDLAGAMEAFEHDPDPTVRRRALRLLCSAHPPLDRPARERAAAVASCSPDARVRAQGAALFTPAGGPHALAALLALSRDSSLAVRAAASDQIERWPDLARALGDLLASGRELAEETGASTLPRRLSGEERASALAWMAQVGDEAALDRLVEEVIAEGSQIEQAAGPAREEGLRSSVPPAIAPRLLGQTGIAVSPLGISGAYEPSLAALEEAQAAGITTFFWEPRHANLTRFLRTKAREGEPRVIVAGSYHADARSIEHDLALALRRLRTDCIDVFLLFWSRSAARLSPGVFAIMTELKRSGRVRAIGFSTHDRALAQQALEAHSWDVLMIRHSAAHPGAEREVLPLAERRGVGVIAFNALCYGQLLRAPPGHPHGVPLTAADCYRYSLSQAGVSLCLSAPRRASEVAENLQAAIHPQLGPEALAQARAHGAEIHAQSRLFNAHIRRPGSEPPDRALLHLLEATEGEFEHPFDTDTRPALAALATRPRRPSRRWARQSEAAP